LRIVHVSEPYNTTDCTREVYILSHSGNQNIYFGYLENNVGYPEESLDLRYKSIAIAPKTLLVQ